MSFSWKTARKFWLGSVHVEHNSFLSRGCINFLAATTKYDKLCGLNNKNSLSHSSGSYNSKIKVSPRLAPPEDYETGLIPCFSPGFWRFLGGNLWRCYDMCHSSLPLSPLGILSVCLWLSPYSPACKNSSHLGLGPPKRPYLQIMSHSGVLGWPLQHMSFVVQLLSHVQLFATPWTSAHQASLSITISWSLPKLMSIESVMLSNYLILCRPLLLLPSIFPSIRVFSNEFFTSGSQSIGVSPSVSVLPMNIQGWFPFGLTGLIYLLCKGLSKVFSNITVWKHQFFNTQSFPDPTLRAVHDYWKNHSFDYVDLCRQSDVSAF